MLKVLLLVDFVMSLAVIQYIINPCESSKEFGVPCNQLAGDNKACHTETVALLLFTRFFYAKSLVHSFCILAAWLSKEKLVTAIIASATCVWCFYMPYMLYIHNDYFKSNQISLLKVVLPTFGLLYMKAIYTHLTRD